MKFEWLSFEPVRESYSFGVLTCRQGDTRHMVNPINGESMEVVLAGYATQEEIQALVGVFQRHEVVFDESDLDYAGRFDGTTLVIPNTDLRPQHVSGRVVGPFFSGAEIDLAGDKISDSSLAVVLEMARAANLRLTGQPQSCPNGVATEDLVPLVRELRDGEVIVVDTVPKLRQWLATTQADD